MGYIYGKPHQSRRDGAWWYWGQHKPRQPTPEIVGPFKTEDEALEDAIGRWPDA